MNQIDKRSQDVRDQSLRFTIDGKVDQRSQAVKEGRILPRGDGGIHEGSSAIYQGTTLLSPSYVGEERRAFTQEEIDAAWEKGEVAPGQDPDLYRQDKSGNIIYQYSYGKDSDMGWNVDHSKPLHEGGTYHPNNLQPFQTEQNKAKGSVYPYNFADNEPRGITQVQEYTPIDERSHEVRSGDVTINKDGKPRKNCKAVNQGDVLLTPNGEVDPTSPAVQEGSLRFKPSEQSSMNEKVSSVPENPSSNQTTSSPDSSSTSEPPSNSSSTGSLTPSGQEIFEGPRGGHFVETASGNKRYV